VARKTRICFVGLDNYSVLNPEMGAQYVGGESVQQTLLAKGFEKRGYDVSMIVKDVGQPQRQSIENIKVFKTFEQSAGLPFIRFFVPRLTSIWAALRSANADIYYQSCAGMLTGVVARFCKVHDRRFIFRLAHDSDCIPGEQLIKYWRDRKLYEYGLRSADFVAAQGINQIELLKKYYGLASEHINMVVELPDKLVSKSKTIDVLWVNNIREFKRPELVLELAQKMPSHKFVMIGGAVPGFEQLYEDIKNNAREIQNLEFVGPVSYHKVNNYFLETKLFLNTSDSEGFPNSFLQAWVRSVPVVSFFDPDNIIRVKGIGRTPQDLGEMKSDVDALLSDDLGRTTMGDVANRFVVDKYSSEAVVQTYESALNMQPLKNVQ